MRRAEDVVKLLSFSCSASDGAHELEKHVLTKFSAREWEQLLRWLDDSGLAFYCLQKLKNVGATDAVPPSVLYRLERNFAANQRRVEDMSQRFGFLNQKFTEAGVRYAVLKGFSLVPQFCPDASLRHQGDFDYLVDAQSLSVAQRVLVEAGYVPRESRSRQEFIFVKPGMGEASRSSGQYSSTAPHAVELHLDVWHSDLHGLALIERQFSVERTVTQRWNELAFPALTDADAFLLQVLHACQHLFTYWIRMSCLFEIGYFLNHRASDTLLWDRIALRVRDNPVLRDFVVVIAELVAKLFAAPLPAQVRAWGSMIRPGSRVWIENYARRWAFCDVPVHDFRFLPRAKLVLFLHQQYVDACAEKPRVRGQVLTFSRLSRIASSLKNKPYMVLSPVWWKHELLIRRSLFHALAGLRYLCELPRWRWLNRVKMPSVDA